MRAFVLGITLLSMLFACQSQDKTAPISNTNISAIVNDTKTVFVDVRIPEQFNERTVKGAINIPLVEIASHANELKGKQVVLFCNTGRQAGQALEILKEAGVESVYSGINVDTVDTLQKEKK